MDNNFFELISQRESCRNYSVKPVEKEKLVACMEASRIAPSACNSQPWSFIVVNNKEISPKIAKCLQDDGLNKFADNCPAFIIVIEETAYLMAKEGGTKENQKFASIDIGLSTMQICLAATAQGLSTCIMGSFSEDKIKKLLDIKDSKSIRLVISVGYAANDKLRKKIRKDIDEFVQFID